MTANAATDKQIAFRAELIERILNSTAKEIEARTSQVAPLVAVAAIAVSLPMPATSAEASAQIDALKGNLKAYAGTNRELYGPIVAKIMAGVTHETLDRETFVNFKGESIPSIKAVTANTLRTTIARVLA